jgi:hypothetical protein
MTKKSGKLNVFQRDEIASGVVPAPTKVPYDLYARVAFNAGIDAGIYSKTGPVAKALASSKPIKKKPRKLFADASDSTCFDDLSYEGGVVTAIFTDGSIYDYPMSKSEARDWFDDPSLGGYFNSVVREPTKKGANK